MKREKTITVIRAALFAALLAAVSSAALAGQFIFSLDGSTVGSSPRELPTQGVSLSTGKVVVGLHALSDAARADCGWYRIVRTEHPQAQSNEFYTVTGYCFTNFTAETVWTCRWRKVKPRTFSKLRLKIAVAELGSLAALETWLGSFEIKPGYSALAAWNDAQELADDFEGFAQIREAAKSALGVTDEQIEAILNAAEVKK